MPTISITVKDKIATVSGTPRIICGNSDYSISFAFDDEFSAYESKTLRLVFRRRGEQKYYDIVFSGDSVDLPALYEIDMVVIGVYCGDIISTSTVAIQCVYSASSEHEDPPPDVYEQLIEYIEGLSPSGGGGVYAGVMTVRGTFASCDAAVFLQEVE